VRFFRVEEAVLLLFAAIGLTVMVLTGAAGPVASGIVPVAFVLALLTPRAWMESRRWERGWTLAAVTVVALAAASALAGGSLLAVTAQLAVYLQIQKLFRRLSARDHEQIALLSLGHVAFATVLLAGLRYAALLVVFLALTPLLLTLLHLRREIEQKYAGSPEAGRDDQTLVRVLRTRRVATPGFVGFLVATAVPLILLTTLFFVALPRLGFGLLAGRSDGQFLVGFSERMVLGDLVPLADDRTPVFRVEFPDGSPPGSLLASLRFRGTTFDTYDGRAWQRTAPDPSAHAGFGPRFTLDVPGPEPSRTVSMHVVQEPFEPRLLFLPAGARDFDLRAPLPRRPGPRRSPLRWHSDGVAEYRESGDEGIPFDVRVGVWPDGTRTPAPAGIPDGIRDPYRSLPPDADRIVALARSLTRDWPDPRDRADALLAHLLARYRYARSTHARAGDRPIEDFLFRWHEGHCEYFSSAMTLLARAAGLRARNVSGFLGGHWNELGEYLVVRQSNAHSWAEVEIPGEGWIVYEATPSAEEAALSRTGGVLGWLSDLFDALRTSWNRHVVAFDLKRQIGILNAIGAAYRAVRDATASFALANRTPLTVAGLLIGLAVGAFLLRRFLLRRRSPADGLDRRHAPPHPRHAAEARRLLAQVERTLRSLGIERGIHEPVERLVERTGPLGEPLAAAAARALDRYQAARFGLHRLETAERRRLARDVAQAARRKGSDTII
jgi:hypothetical protein